ncbi:uncharacterized protein [Lepeophtheirus salmonis]|uniref:Putative LOC100114681 [Nasonia vitripennis] n=1 Tax=Lepeophtheirus salmonis TaxID=72036 RepID=A0A0K2SX11_LEPSM|nr:uncharacterized protein LOC121115748 [Lepeophtheirus salmonis]
MFNNKISFVLFLALFGCSPSLTQRRGRQQSAPSSYGVSNAQPQASYGNPQPNYGGPPPPPQPAPSVVEPSNSHDHSGLDWLLNSVPGTPGTDYPILAEVPETGFACDGQVEGGYYADTETQCQVFHVCVADGVGSLAKQSFLCPNGTIFNQGYFICDWWFNFDCAQAEDLYSKNEEVQAERESAPVFSPSTNSGSPSRPTPARPSPSQPQNPSFSDPPLGTYGRQGRRTGK